MNALSCSGDLLVEKLETKLVVFDPRCM